MRRLGLIGCLIVVAGLLFGQPSSPIISNVPLRDAQAKVLELQKEIAAVLQSMPSLPQKDQFETTADYRKRTQSWFELEAERAGKFWATEQELKRQFYLSIDKKPTFVGYDADSEVLTASISGGPCSFKIPKETAKAMYGSWDSVSVAENLELMADPAATANPSRSKAPVGKPALGLAFGSNFFIGFGKRSSRPTLLQKVGPEMSDQARKSKEPGPWFVALSVLISASGKAEDIKVTKSAGLGLDEKAIEAVRKWRFTQGSDNCVPSGQRVTIEVNFRKF